MKRSNADLEARGETVSRDGSGLKFLGEGRAGTVGERSRSRTAETVCCVSIKKRQQRRIGAATGQVEERRWKDERILAGCTPHRSAEEVLVLTRIAGCAMCESHLSRIPPDARGNAAGSHPRRKDQLGRLTRCRDTAGQAMRQDRVIARFLESDV